MSSDLIFFYNNKKICSANLNLIVFCFFFFNIRSRVAIWSFLKINCVVIWLYLELKKMQSLKNVEIRLYFGVMAKIVTVWKLRILVLAKWKLFFEIWPFHFILAGNPGCDLQQQHCRVKMWPPWICGDGIHHSCE